MKSFSPIAIVGCGCVLPGAHTREDLWRAVVDNRDLLTEVSPSRWWVPPELMSPKTYVDPELPSIPTTRGGYVRDFDQRFDPNGFVRTPEEILALDKHLHWLLHASREAMMQAKLPPTSGSVRAGMFLGYLGYPSTSFIQYAERVSLRRAGTPAPWLPREVHPGNIFHPGFGAHFVADCLGLTEGAYSLDAACASSLYAIKLACDWLHDGRADLMLAGAVNGSDPLLIHGGFSALTALSPTGESLPFQQGANGLVPSEGAGIVALMRLEDAVARDCEIVGVVRGVGVGNTGRHRTFLAPSPQGQLRAMKSAYENSGVPPRRISLVECHATGTPVGDGVELTALDELLPRGGEVPIGSLKSNLGHSITTAGVAGLFKVLSAFESRTLPPTRITGPLREELSQSRLRVLTKAENWNAEGPRCAAVSAFGFGGTNAHLIVEEYQPPRRQHALGGLPSSTASDHSSMTRDGDRPAIAVVGVAVRAGNAEDWSTFANSLLTGEPPTKSSIDEIVLDGRTTPFAPRDLERCLASHLLPVGLVQRAINNLDLPSESTGVFLGTGGSPETCQTALRTRFLYMERETPEFNGSLREAATQMSPALNAARTLGCMANILANRINMVHDFQGSSFTLFGEELAGLHALELASRALAMRELDAALVGASHFAVNPIHDAAISELRGRTVESADAGVVFCLKRLDDARDAGDEVLAILERSKLVVGEEEPDNQLHWTQSDGRGLVNELFGDSHAASGLLGVAAAITSIVSRRKPVGIHRQAEPWVARPGRRSVRLDAEGLGGSTQSLVIRESPAMRRGPHLASTFFPRIYGFSGQDRSALVDALRRGQITSDNPGTGPARAAIVARNEEECRTRARTLAEMLASADGPVVSGDRQSFAYDRPMEGKVALLGSSAAAAYPLMGIEIIETFRELADDATRRAPFPRAISDWFRPEGPPDPQAYEKLVGNKWLTYLHSRVSREILGLEFQIAFGLSSGELDAALAMGITPIEEYVGVLERLKDRQYFERHLAGDFETARRAWRLPNEEAVDWTLWRVFGSVDDIRQAIASEPRVHLAIIHTQQDLVVAGQRSACERAFARLGRPTRFEVSDYRLTFHVPEAFGAEEILRHTHTMKLNVPDNLRFYSGVWRKPYPLTSETFADAYVANATEMIDYPKLVEAVYADGARIFVEHGARDLCTQWLSANLGTRPHVAVSLDAGKKRGALLQTALAAAQLWSAGVAVDIAPWNEHLHEIDSRRPPTMARPDIAFTFAGHLPELAPVSLQPRKAESVKNDRIEHEVGDRVDPVAVPRPELVARETSQLVPMPPMVPPVRLGATSMVANRLAPITAVAESGPEHAIRDDRTQAVAPLTGLLSSEDGQELERRIEETVAQGTSTRTVSANNLKLFEDYVAKLKSGHEEFLAYRGQMQRQLSDRIASLRDRAPSFPPKRVGASAKATPMSPGVEGAGTGSKPSSAPERKKPFVPKTVCTVCQPRGLAFAYDDVLKLAGGKISEVFGPLFEQQDHYERQVRLPLPPVLLVDRIIGLEAEPGVASSGVIWTETDVHPDAWYIHHGRIAPGVMIEAGQADLTLISYMGADFENRGERVYRLLGCDLTYHRHPAVAGETIRYEIHIDRHVRHGDIRIFFFHYDGYIGDERVMSVRNGHAGFFSDRELEESGGVVWSIETAEAPPEGRVDEPVVAHVPRSLGRAQVDALFRGDVVGCFGTDYAMAKTHSRTPTPTTPRMQLVHEVEVIDPHGGPWKRGYMRAIRDIAPDDWFFEGHFLNDPVMPGTLICDSVQQCMAIYLTAFGYTLERDGWQFEPLAEQEFELRCRGQVLPNSKRMVTELWIREVHEGPEPILIASVLCTVDGLKALNCPRIAIKLAPDSLLDLESIVPDASAVDRVVTLDGLPLDERALQSCATGRPSDAFGKLYERFDGPDSCPRLPSPPLHQMTRVTGLDAEPGVVRVGSSVVVEYDVPPDAWYFTESGSGTMPFGLLLETNLQPCGWLATFGGTPVRSEQRLYFRNLDGKGIVHRDVGPDTGTLVTRTELTKHNRFGGTTIVAFRTECHAGAERVSEFETSFGFFTRDALAGQVGLPPTEEEQSALAAPSDYQVDLTLPGALGVGTGRLCMIHRVTGYWPRGGSAGLGRFRAERDIAPDDFYFKSHFFQDPVQPGSLGLEAMVQLQRYAMESQGLLPSGHDIRFEALGTEEEVAWTYRGQVLPHSKLVTLELEILEVKRLEDAVTTIARGYLWVDGTRIYGVPRMALSAIRRSR
ncbi:Phthiocerol/phenolphthiocerol synthesis polyketide synthase type I PpsA [Planctomycetes bacterium Pan216]|uniref:Phthiocerol/phenolphthiocerol synthesis polyketide synthase type I PpsA n=1 Tax=Kolteria novifilia TaxID=2527975 RepID=A0A518AXC2_9BACT|nr:Phthiocerol/phenolphthiocerol synthesis polyketide synthase type I PpsA [Planctomycetes bacterium Pan216]